MKKTNKNSLSKEKKTSSFTMKAIIIVEIVVIVLFSTLTHGYNVPTGSMEPTIKAGSFVIGNLVSYRTKDPERFDVITFENPDYEDKYLCKRIIGLPGETVEVTEGKTYINGEYMEEDFVKNSFTTTNGTFYVPKAGDIVTVDYDNNACFINDIQVGYITNSLYNEDTETTVYFDGFLDMYCEKQDDNYVVIKDCYFCMGDNRDNSLDGRYWQNKYVTVDDIRAKMVFNVSSFSSVK